MIPPSHVPTMGPQHYATVSYMSPSLPRHSLSFPWQRHQEKTPSPSFQTTCRLTYSATPPDTFISLKTHSLCPPPCPDARSFPQRHPHTPPQPWALHLTFHSSQPLQTLFTVTPLTSSCPQVPPASWWSSDSCFSVTIFLNSHCWSPSPSTPYSQFQL